MLNKKTLKYFGDFNYFLFLRLLSEFTPFEWDEVYAFNPYVSKETIYETIGYKWDRISETVSEGMNQIVFLKDEEVVYLTAFN